MNSDHRLERSLGLLGATGVGVGAIVGGGILALAGAAYVTTGPGAIVAFALNGVIAFLTALSFAEMSASFPESGGPYTFSKKVFSIQTAFAVGWVVWFASISASVLYALGFASFGVIALGQLCRLISSVPPDWLAGPHGVTVLAVGATAAYTIALMWRSTGGRQWATIGKVLVFVVLIAAGLWALRARSLESVSGNLTPFFTGGAIGLFQAMGYTFIALQGFDLIAAVAGEVRDPGRTIPRAMFLSLTTALAIYIPLLFIIATVGILPGQSITSLSAEHTDTVIAVAARNYIGPLGYWLVIVAAILSMASALRANLFAASRVAFAMARDRTLPTMMGNINERLRTPIRAIWLSTIPVVVILFIIPDLPTAGAVSSLIFLISFALAHLTCFLARRRGSALQAPFRVPFYPLIPIAGGCICLALAIFQGIAVPHAGLIAVFWLGLGSILFLVIFAHRARVVDARDQAHDPMIVQLRGLSPLVLVPIANPANAEAMVTVAHALAPPVVGRVLLLSVVSPPLLWQPGEYPSQLLDAQAVLREALASSFAAGLSPEALTIIAPRPWSEISRVSRTYRCESLLLGLGNLSDSGIESHIEELTSAVDCNVVILRGPAAWRISEVRRILVPVGGRGYQNEFRARLLASLCRGGSREVTFLQVLPSMADEARCQRVQRALVRLAQDEIPGHYQTSVVRSDDIAEGIIRQTADADLMVLGFQRFHRRRKVLGDIILRVLRGTTCGVIIISRRG